MTTSTSPTAQRIKVHMTFQDQQHGQLLHREMSDLIEFVPNPEKADIILSDEVRDIQNSFCTDKPCGLFQKGPIKPRGLSENVSVLPFKIIEIVKFISRARA